MPTLRSPEIPLPLDRERIRDSAAQVLLGNLKRGHDHRSKYDYAYVCPARRGYPWQWFWDSCFHAIALTHVDLALAKQELRTLLAVQAPDGFIPHVIYWGASPWPHPSAFLQSKLAWRALHSALIQPPVLAQALLRVYERSQDTSFLTETLDRVKRYYLWLRDHRDPDADHLISVISPYETGMDQLPAYDSVLGARNPSRLGLQLRGRLLDAHNLVHGRNYNLERLFRLNRFNVEDVLVNCLYAQGLRAIARLCAISDDSVSAESFSRLARRTEQALLERCYDPSRRAFFSLAGTHERKLDVLTVTSLMPIILEDLPKEVLTPMIERHLLNRNDFWLDYPIPSVARSEPTFRADAAFLIWRGATWLNINWFLYQGLRKHGFPEPAALIARKSLELVQRSGFREFYNPLTGEGLGERDFGWSTLVIDML